MKNYKTISFENNKYAQISSFLTYAATLTKKPSTTKMLITLAAQFGGSDFFVPDITPTRLVAMVDDISDELAADEYRVDNCPIITRDIKAIFHTVASKTYGDECASIDDSVCVEILDEEGPDCDCGEHCCGCWLFYRNRGKCYSRNIYHLPTITTFMQKIIQAIREADDIAVRSMTWEFTKASESEFGYGAIDSSNPVNDALRAIHYSAGDY